MKLTTPIIYVNSSGTGDNNGTSWKHAYRSLARFHECEGWDKVPYVSCYHTEPEAK